jgi:hypothetical protein
MILTGENLSIRRKLCLSATSPTTNIKLINLLILGRNCIMTNVMHKFLIYLSIYVCLTCFGLSFSPFSDAGVQIVHYVGHYTISFQNARSLQHKVKTFCKVLFLQAVNRFFSLLKISSLIGLQ